MKTRFDVKSLLLGLMVGVAITLSVGAATTSRTKWEYAVVQGLVFGKETLPSQPLLESVLNRGAEQGWDLVQAGRSVDQWGFAIMRREKH